MTSSTPKQDGVTGTQRLYVQFMNSEAKVWGVNPPSYAADLKDQSPEKVKLAKAAYLKYVSDCLQTFKNGDVLASMLNAWHATTTVAEYKALVYSRTATVNINAFVENLGLRDHKVPAAWNTDHDNIIARAPNAIRGVMQCQANASVCDLKMLVTPYSVASWTAGKGQFKLAFMRVMPL